jgi:transcription elongation GreA/GreB family factor
MSELRLLNCVENGAGICRNELLFEAMQESFNGLKEKNRVLAEELDNLRASKGIDEIIARAEAAEVRVAELEAARERFEVTDDLLNQATVTIGAVIACCTYNSNEDAKIGIYGISPDAFTRIDQFITNYNRAVSAGKVSVDVKPVQRPADPSLEEDE